MLMPSDIVKDVLAVLQKANKGKYGTSAKSVTAYIILDRLVHRGTNEDAGMSLRDLLISERGMPGKGSGVSYSAASVVADACELLAKGDDPSVAIEYADCEGERFLVADQLIEAGYSGHVCARYRAV